MGQWSMHIEGQGVHDNGRPDDADTMLKQFVEQLRQHQQVSAATFTVGSTRSVRDDGSLREAQADAGQGHQKR